MANNQKYLEAAIELQSNPGQLKAFNSKGHTVVLAGPGSGKTKTLTVKMARMLAEDISAPRKIACLTYSNQCARELCRKLNQLGVEDGKGTFIGTVHSFCYQQIIKPYAKLAGIQLPEPHEVASPTKQVDLLLEAIKTIKPDIDPNWLKETVNDFRKTVLDRTSEEWTNNDYERPMIEAYESKLNTEGLIDFDGMVLTSVDLINNNLWIRKALRAKFPVLIIDEYQDLGVPLHQIVLKLCIESGIRLFAVGDPDQSIYGFNGARPNLLRELAENDYIEKIELALNYRCGAQIIQVSSAMLNRGVNYESATGHEGNIYQYACPIGFEEQLSKVFYEIIPNILENGIALGEIGILYPNKGDGQLIADAAKNAGFDYLRFDSGNPYRRTPIIGWLEECASWCAGGWETGEPKLSQLISVWLKFNPSLIFEEQILTYKRRLAQFLFNNRCSNMRLQEWLESSGKIRLFENFKNERLYLDEYESLKELYNSVKTGGAYEKFTVESLSGQKGSLDHLNLSTMHSAKGLEYDVVILPGLEDGKMPRTYKTTPRQLEETRRLFYVSLTRAKKEIHLLWSGFTVDRYGRIHSNGRSSFINEINKKMNWTW